LLCHQVRLAFGSDSPILTLDTERRAMPRKTEDVALIDLVPVIGGRAPANVRRRVEIIEKLLEGLFVIPGINRRVGLDVILDTLPVAGDTIATILGAYMVWEARNLNMPKFTILRMIGHVGLNALIGIIPFAGAVATFFYRSNTYNLKLIIKHLDKHHPAGAVIEG
jgi:hypothetical protein